MFYDLIDLYSWWEGSFQELHFRIASAYSANVGYEQMA